ncbi:hypothetical protein Q0M30_18455, partial [Staphylococcus aureus]|nr:hypothetical protein [Staphylococcus aureus]
PIRSQDITHCQLLNNTKLQLDIEHKPNLESLFASVKTNQSVTIITQSLKTKVNSMDINYRQLVGINVDRINSL